jgi:DNA-binding response OmpR family regulator
MTTKILWLEGSRAVTPSFIPGLQAKGYQVEYVPTCKAALARLDTFSPNLGVVNAASFRGNARRTCHTLREHLNGHPLFLICEQEQRPVETEASQVLVLPFTLRKLLNRIQALVPAQEGKALQLGPLTLYPSCHLLQVNGHDPQRLTPTLTALLRAFMQRPGEVWAREDLFREVWQTDYVGDTRTLDTHISWLRRKIEEPEMPGLLMTIRGVGYRLDG